MLGKKVKDIITGFEGIVTGRAQYITGCDQLLVQPISKSGEYIEGRWFDDMRLDVVDDDVLEICKEGKNGKPGADIPAPVK